MANFESKAGVITWDGTNETLVVQTSGYVQFDYSKEFMDKALGLLIENHASKWLGDQRNAFTMGKELQDWLENDWFPRAVKGGLKKMAVVIPDNIIQQNVIKRATDKGTSTGPIESKTFSGYKEAVEWLNSK